MVEDAGVTAERGAEAWSTLSISCKRVTYGPQPIASIACTLDFYSNCFAVFSVFLIFFLSLVGNRLAFLRK